jgi:signal transduction histidine kinase
MRWYRSLYWRIALGVVAFLAAMLVAQAMLFVWVVSQSGRSLPGQSPMRLARTVALDLANLLERDPQTDLAQYVREQYAQYEHPFFVMMADGRLITSGSRSFPEPLIRMARARLERGEGGRAGRGAPPGDADGAQMDRPRGPRFGGRFGGERLGPASIVVGGRLAGVVMVPPQAPFVFLLRRFAPMLAAVAAAVLILGAVLTSALIFGPPRKRLRQLEDAARRFGAGDPTARAPERGGDEIAAVASAFNAMADDLAARAAALADADRMRRQLLADVSHELNTPVTAMRGYLDTLAMQELALDEPTRARYLRIIGDETARLERLIGELLDLARLEGGGGSLRVERVDTHQLFERVRARHERACADAGIRMEATVEAGAASVSGDPDRLEQALQNLAANAIRYAPPGTAVRLSATRRPDGVALAVADAGPGIPTDQLPHVFDRFYKGEASRVSGAGTSAVAQGGSGLGLSIVKAITERHGGRVDVRSRPGETIFELVLPESGASPQQGG